MKKNFIITLVAILASGSIVLAGPLLNTVKLKPGTYVCNDPNPKPHKCSIIVEKNESWYAVDCHRQDDQGIYDLVKFGKCTYYTDQSKYYSCQYASGSCLVQIRQGSTDMSVSCSGNAPGGTDRAKADVKAGKCYKE